MVCFIGQVLWYFWLAHLSWHEHNQHRQSKRPERMAQAPLRLQLQVCTLESYHSKQLIRFHTGCGLGTLGAGTCRRACSCMQRCECTRSSCIYFVTHLHARVGDADWPPSGNAVEEELLHGVVVQRAVDVDRPDGREVDAALREQLLRV